MADPVAHWLATSFGQAVAAHIKNGLWVFPLHGICKDLSCTCGENPCGKNNKNAGKHPYSRTVPNGLLNAVNDPQVAAELFEYRTDLNVGAVTGKKSGIAVMDIDNKNNHQGDESLVRLQELLGIIPPTMKLPTGNGYHLVFDYPKGGLKSSTNSFGDAYSGIDIRGDGGYIVIYPSRHFSGKYYKADSSCQNISDLPTLYLDYLGLDRGKKSGPVSDRQQRSGAASEWTEDQIGEALSFLNPDMGYHEWIFVGMGLHRDGFSLDMWDKWSSGGSKYAGIGDLSAHWKSFKSNGERTIGTIIEWATVQGWKPKGDHIERVPSAQAKAAVAPLLKKIEEKKSQNPAPRLNGHAHPVFTPTLPDPLQIPGPLGDTIRYITKYAIYDQPELAMMNVLSFAGAIFGRRYCSPLNTRTNLYMVGIAETGAGKEFSVSVIETLALHAGLIDHVGGNSVRSDVGVMKSLAKHASQLMMVDEFGKLMTALGDPRASYHHRAIIDLFTKIYSKSSGVYKPGEVADERAAKITIHSPNLCLYGVTTESSYVPSLKRGAIESGDLNRFIVLPSHRKSLPKKDMPIIEPDDDLIAWWKNFSPSADSSLGIICNNGSIAPTSKLVEWGECAQRQFDIQVEQTNIRDSSLKNRSLWIRLHENTIKLAMIFAIARDPVNPAMILQDMEYAYDIVKSSILYMDFLANHYMADTPLEQAYNEILFAIVEKGASGLIRTEMLNKFRKFGKKYVDEIIGSLVEEGAITVGRFSPQGLRPQPVYYKSGWNSDSGAA